MSEITERLRKVCIDWDGAEVDNLAEPVHPISCGDLRAAADHIEAQEARIAELEKALRGLHNAVCGETGFANSVRVYSGLAYPWPALDAAEAVADDALSKPQTQ